MADVPDAAPERPRRRALNWLLALLALWALWMMLAAGAQRLWDVMLFGPMSIG